MRTEIYRPKRPGRPAEAKLSDLFFLARAKIFRRRKGSTNHLREANSSSHAKREPVSPARPSPRPRERSRTCGSDGGEASAEDFGSLGLMPVVHIEVSSKAREELCRTAVANGCTLADLRLQSALLKRRHARRSCGSKRRY